MSWRAHWWCGALLLAALGLPLTPSRPSWAAGRSGCWAAHRRRRWSRCPAAWTAPRRCGWPAGCGGARCCGAGWWISARRVRGGRRRAGLGAAGHAPGLLVVAAGVARQLQHLSGQVLQHGGQVHRGAGAHAGGVLALLQVAGDAAHGELQASLGAAAHSLLGGLSLAAAGHGGWWVAGGEGAGGGASVCGATRRRGGRPRGVVREPRSYWPARPLRRGPKRVAGHTCAPPPVHSAPMAPKKADKKPAAKTTKPAVKKGKKKSKARAPSAHPRHPRARLTPPARHRPSPTRSTSTRC